MAQSREDRYHAGLRCEERVDSGLMAFPCSLPRGHDGPHYVMESAKSRFAREQWEQQQETGETKPEPVHITVNHDQMCAYGGAHEGDCKPVEGQPTTLSVRADTHPEGGYLVTLPTGEQVHLTEEDVVARPSGVIGVQESLRELVDPGGFVKFDLPGPTKQREGDQRLPDVDHRRGDVQSLVIRDIEERRRVGISRYGTALQTFNGRNTLRDLYEECIDSTVYARSLLEMRDATREELMEAARSARYGEETDTYTWERVAEAILDKILDAVALKIADGQDCG